MKMNNAIASAILAFTGAMVSVVNGAPIAGGGPNGITLPGDDPSKGPCVDDCGEDDPDKGLIGPPFANPPYGPPKTGVFSFTMTPTPASTFIPRLPHITPPGGLPGFITVPVTDGSYAPYVPSQTCNSGGYICMDIQTPTTGAPTSASTEPQLHLTTIYDEPTFLRPLPQKTVSPFTQTGGSLFLTTIDEATFTPRPTPFTTDIPARDLAQPQPTEYGLTFPDGFGRG